MPNLDRKQFAEIFFGMEEYFGKKHKKVVVEMYFQGLQDLSQDQFRLAECLWTWIQGAYPLTGNNHQNILTPEEVAQYLRKSLSWVYKNEALLGARKLGGSLFFPSKEDLYERLFEKGEGLAIRLHPQRNPVHGSLVQNQNSGQTSRSTKKGGTQKAGNNASACRSICLSNECESGSDNPNRYGLLDIG